eukprot:gene1136-2499_t
MPETTAAAGTAPAVRAKGARVRESSSRAELMGRMVLYAAGLSVQDLQKALKVVVELRDHVRTRRRGRRRGARHKRNNAVQCGSEMPDHGSWSCADAKPRRRYTFEELMELLPPDDDVAEPLPHMMPECVPTCMMDAAEVTTELGEPMDNSDMGSFRPGLLNKSMADAHATHFLLERGQRTVEAAPVQRPIVVNGKVSPTRLGLALTERRFDVASFYEWEKDTRIGDTEAVLRTVAE